MNVPFSKPLTDRELRWLRHIAVHGPQSSEFLLEVCADTHRCKDTGLRTLQKLRQQNFLRLPPQQNQIAKADFNPYVYDLTRKAELHLSGLGDSKTVRPTGHWWHGFLTASITSAIEIEANKRGFRYIPAHEILSRSGATLAVPYGKRKIIPDQLFAIDYGGKFRSFALEVDRGTEPYRSEAARKSLRGMIEAYADLAAKDALRRHYGLKSPLLVSLVFSSPFRASKFLDLLTADVAAVSRIALTSVVPLGFQRYSSLSSAIKAPWSRQQDIPISLFTPELSKNS